MDLRFKIEGPNVIGYVPVSKEPVKDYKCYFHFSNRLFQRYRVSITLEEYLELCKTPVVQIDEPFKNKKIGWLTIKGVPVRVVKGTKKGKLITALPLTSTEFFNSSHT